MAFTLTPSNVFIRNAQVLVKPTSGDSLTDVGLVANVKVEFKPINSESTLGAATGGYDVTVTADMLQSALADVQAALGLAGAQLAEVDFVGEADKIVLTDWMLNPAPSIDMTGGESKITLAGHRKLTRSQALALQQAV